MQISLQGIETVEVEREKVFDMLVDPNFIARSLPDAEEVRVLDQNTVDARLRVRIALVSASMKARITIGERRRPEFASLNVDAYGSGSNVKISSRLELKEEKPTKLEWKADVEITGIMSGLGSSIIKSFADKKVREIFEKIIKEMKAGQS